MHVSQQGWWVEEALGRQGIAGLPAGRALCDPLGHIVRDALELVGIDDGSHVNRLVQRRSDAQILQPRADLGEELLRDALVNQQAGAGAADLALVEPDGIHQALHSGVEIGVVKDNEGRFAAEFQRQLLG